MRRRLLAVGGLCALLLSSCNGGGVTDASAGENGAAEIGLPNQLVGLRVQPEDISPQLEAVDRPYVDSVAVFSMRDEDLLRATLQMARFNDLADPGDPEFRGAITGTIGGREPIEIKVGDVVVTATTVTDQRVFTWFSGNGLFILSVTKDFEFPRTLLRRVVELGLEL